MAEHELNKIVDDNGEVYNLRDNTKQPVADKVTAWGSTPSDTKYPSEKLVKDALDAKNDRIVWDTVTKGQTWSRIYRATPTMSTIGCSGVLSISATRGSVVYNITFLITSSHAGSNYVNIIELASCNYSPVRVRAVASRSGDYYLELYDTASSIAAGTTQEWHCRYIPVLEATVTTYTAFQDGTTIPSGYSAVNDFTTTVGSSAAAIKSITRSGTTFTATRQDGSTFTFTQQDSNTDTKVKATAKTDNANYKILATASESPTSGGATEAVYDTDVTLNPSTNTISANISGNAATATTAAGYTSGGAIDTALQGKVEAASVRLYTNTANTQYYKIAECNAPADYTNAALSLDYWIVRATAKSERGTVEISARPQNDGSYGINHFAAYQQKKVGTVNYGLSFILTMATVGETVHMELWASLSKSYVGLFASGRFSKRNGRNDGTSIWSFIENPEATATAPTQPSGGLIATATPSFDVKVASTSAVGSGTVPVYVDGSGDVQACTGGALHTHDNKSVLDGITATDVANWNAAETNVQSDWLATSGDAFIKNKPLYDVYSGSSSKYVVIASVKTTGTGSGDSWSILICTRYSQKGAFCILQGHGDLRCSWLFTEGDVTANKVEFYTTPDPNTSGNTLIIASLGTYVRLQATSFSRVDNVDFSVFGNDEPTGTTHDSSNRITEESIVQAAASSGDAPVKVDSYGELVAVPMDTIPTVNSTNLVTSGGINTAVVAIADAYAKANNVSNRWCKVAEYTWTGVTSTFGSSWMVTFLTSSGAMTSESFFLNFAIRANASGAAPTLRTFVTSIINTPSATNSRRFKMVISGSSGNMTMKLYYSNGASNYSSMTIREITATQQSSAGKSKNTWSYTSYNSGSGDTTEPTGDYNYECEFVYASSLAVASAGTATTAQNYDASTGTIKTALEGKANLNSYGYIATSNIPVIQYRASSASTLRICRVPSPSNSTMSVLECNVRWASSYARIIIQSRGWVANVIGASLESYGLAFYKQAVTVNDTTYYDIIAVIPSYCRCVFAASFLWYNSNIDFSVYGNVEYTPVAADKITYSYSAQSLDSSGTAPVKVDALGNLSAVPMDSTPTPSSTNLMTSGDIATALAAKQPGRVIIAPTYSGGVWSNDFATVLEAIEDGKDVFLYTGNSEGNVDTYHMVPLTEVVKSSNNYMAFQFSRPRVWSSTSENGILDTWTCTATPPYWQFEGKNVYYAATAGEAFNAANASNYSSGGTIESTFSAINTALAARALGKTIPLSSGNSLSVTIPWATRTGRSSMLVIVSGNNGVQSCVQVSWFKDANNAITNAKMNVLSYTNTGAGCVPMFYVQYGTQALGACGIYLVLDNSSWITQVTVIPNMENVDSVAFGSVLKSTAQTATDLSSERVWCLQGAWDGTPTSGSSNAVTSNGIYDMTQGYKIRVVGALPGTPDANTLYFV